MGGGVTKRANVIWWLWLQGAENAPDICKACLKSLRRWHSDKKIIVLDQSNLSEYISLPDYITDKYNRGIITPTHYSDIIRSQLLCEHGGIWADATVFCTGRKFESLLHLPLFLFSENKFSSVSSSWLISSQAHHPIMKLTRDLLFEYWRRHDYLLHYFLFHMFFKMATESYADLWSQVPRYSNLPPHEMQFSTCGDCSDERLEYFASISDFHKLTYKIDPSKPPSFVKFIFR